MEQLPHNLDAERRLLACVLRVPHLAVEAAECRPEWFYSEAHRDVWRGIKATLSTDYEPLTFCADVELWLDNNARTQRIAPTLDEVASWFDLLLDEVISPEAEYQPAYIAIRNLYMRREMIRLARTIQHEAHTGCEPSEVLHEWAAELQRIGSATASGEVSMSDVFGEMLGDLEARHEGQSTARQHPTHVWPVDRLLGGGLTQGRYTIVAARPKHGKSRLSIRMAFNLMVESNFAIDWYSQEMGRHDMAKLFVTCLTGISWDELSDPKGQYKGERWAQVATDAIATAKQLPLRVATGSTHVRDIVLRAKARKAQLGDQPFAVFVDYIQVMDGDGESEYDRVSDVSKRLASLSRDLDISVVGMAQFNRRAEEGGIPKPSHLRASGQIEQDVNELLILHRPGADNARADTEEQQKAGLFLSLNRHGPTDRAQMRCDCAKMKFEDWSDWP